LCSCGAAWLAADEDRQAMSFAALAETLDRQVTPLEHAADLELTILMPCLNEAETVATCVRKAVGFLARTGVSGEVVVADNGSTDGSQGLAVEAGARVVPVAEKGYGAALIGGIKAARGRFVIMGDADDSYDFERLEPLLERLRAGDQLVMGNRFQGGIAPGAMPFLHKYLGNPVLSFIGRLFFNIPVGDFHCGLRGFSREAMLELGLKSPGMEFASEMVVKSALYGLRIAEAPTTLRPDGRSRPPHLKTWRDGWRHLRFLLQHSPKWLFIYPGALLTSLGVLGAAVTSMGAFEVAPGIELDTHTLVACCFAILIGVQLVMFGALARRYAMLEGFLPRPRSFHGFLLGLDLEAVLRIALGIFTLGIGGALSAVWMWADAGFGPVDYHVVMRVLAISLTGVAVSAQMAATGFLASIFTIRR
jgi:hypothetical protein